jgi:AraC-like DNA-binding protein
LLLNTEALMRYIIIFSFIFQINILLAQKGFVIKSKDYLELKETARKLSTDEPDKALAIALQIEKSNDFSHKAYAFGIKSFIYQVKNDSAMSQESYNKSIEFLKKIRPSRKKDDLECYIHNFGGLADRKRGNYKSALDKFLIAKRLAEKLQDPIQMIKINMNISTIYIKANKLKQAIKINKESDVLISELSALYTKEEFFSTKANIYMTLGNAYEKIHRKDSKKDSDNKLIDSAIFFYKKCVSYSKNNTNTKFGTYKNIANLFYIKGDFEEAEKIYQNVLTLSQEEKNLEIYFSTLYNLGDLYFFTEKYDKALLFFKKIDSIHEEKKILDLEYINSNFYQAKYYSRMNNKIAAYKHSKIASDTLEKLESKLNEEIKEINASLSREQILEEIDIIEKEYQNEILYNNILRVILILAFLVTIFFGYYNYKKKKIAEQKILKLVEEFKENKNLTLLIQENNNKEISKKNSPISVEKEEEILHKLKKLEEKQDYLKVDYNQQYVAKKLKTNTSYISLVVNKYYGKTFSEYLNEMRINYVINEMISNNTYRKYSTQSIAESAGFKNAISFTKSFNKRTGVTPVQFIKELEKH